MRLCTYNIWNHDKNYENRIEALVSLLEDKEIDLLMLQEVREEAVVLKLKEACAFSHYY